MNAKRYFFTKLITLVLLTGALAPLPPALPLGAGAADESPGCLAQVTARQPGPLRPEGEPNWRRGPFWRSGKSWGGSRA